MRAETFFEQQSSFPDIDGVWNFEDLNLTEIKIRENLPPFTEKTWPAPQIELLTQLARVEALQGKLLEAAGFLALVKELTTRVSNELKPRLELRHLLEQGRVYLLAKTPIQAQDCFRQAWLLAKTAGDTFFAIDAALMLALSQARKFQKEWLMQALKLAEESDDSKSKLWLGYLYLLVGWDYFDMRKYPEAYLEFNKALEIRKSPDVEWAIGRTLRAMNKCDEALTVQNTLMGEFSARGKINGYVYLELAECYQLLKDYNESKKYFDLAYKALQENKWFADNKKHDLDRIQHLSKKS